MKRITKKMSIGPLDNPFGRRYNRNGLIALKKREEATAMITLSIDDAARRLSHLRDQLIKGNQNEMATLTEEGRPVLAVMPWDRYASIVGMMHDPRVLLVAPPEIRSYVLEVAAIHAESLYCDPELVGFEAFGDDDLFTDYFAE
jgi:hypothetical protein